MSGCCVLQQLLQLEAFAKHLWLLWSLAPSLSAAPPLSPTQPAPTKIRWPNQYWKVISADKTNKKSRLCLAADVPHPTSAASRFRLCTSSCARKLVACSNSSWRCDRKWAYWAGLSICKWCSLCSFGTWLECQSNWTPSLVRNLICEWAVVKQE